MRRAGSRKQSLARSVNIASSGDNTTSHTDPLKNGVPDMRNVNEVFDRLQRSSFRQRFRLLATERQYLDRKGLDTVLAHAADFVDKRLAPAWPANDGKQTPMRNHPVFVAQHATATCCRGCLEKWHAIPKGRELSGEEQQYIIAVIGRWLEMQVAQ
jgi:hypothetical protein